MLLIGRKLKFHGANLVIPTGKLSIKLRGMQISLVSVFRLIKGGRAKKVNGLISNGIKNCPGECRLFLNTFLFSQ